MADNASALIAYRTSPHVDYYERAWQGAELLERAMRGDVRPKTVISRRSMLHGLDWGSTQGGPMAELLARGEALERSGEALVASICAGFPLADIYDVGPSVTVTVDERGGDIARGQAIAEEFMDHAWATRNYNSVKMLSVAEAVARAREGKPGDKPLVVADATDNPGGGGYGDATAFLQGLIEAKTAGGCRLIIAPECREITTGTPVSSDVGSFCSRRNWGGQSSIEACTDWRAL